jgi:hypothetical protein
MGEKEIVNEKKKIIANIISVYGIDYDRTIKYVEFNGKYWILWINKFLMYSTFEDNFHSLRGMSEINDEEIDKFIENFIE